jgi:hypothetical protein
MTLIFIHRKCFEPIQSVLLTYNSSREHPGGGAAEQMAIVNFMFAKKLE